MSWISLVCLLALTSSALARSTYGSGYGSVTIPQPVLPRVLPMVNTYETVKPFVPTVPVGYGAQEKLIPKTLTSYGTPMISPPVLPRTFEPVIPRTFEPVNTYSYGSSSLGRTLPVGPIVLPPTQAEILCRGAEAGSVIPIEGNRKFVVCIGDDKGYEQDCPKGLYYHPESRRCERKLGPLENACISQPCLNGGQCLPDGSSFQCQCAPGFDGKTCELDATICQTQFPCGQSPDVRCQSFRLGAALPYVCLFQDSTAYGLSQQQIFPSPCGGIDGPQRLAFGNKGFILCDGERLFIESCPGGTIWDDFNKACAWPDQEGVITGPMFDQEKPLLEERPIKKDSYDSYGTYTQPMPVPTLPKVIVRPTLPKMLEESTSYGSSYTTFTPPPPVFTPPPRIFETTTAGYGYTQPTVPFTPPTPVFTPPPRIFETTTPGYSYTAPPSIVFTPPTPRIIERPTGYSYGAPRILPEPMKPRVLTGY